LIDKKKLFLKKNTNSKHNQMPGDRKHILVLNHVAHTSLTDRVGVSIQTDFSCFAFAALSFSAFFFSLLARSVVVARFYECIFSSTSHLVSFTRTASSGLFFSLFVLVVRTAFLHFFPRKQMRFFRERC
jgi:hypothetical protein